MSFPPMGLLAAALRHSGIIAAFVSIVPFCPALEHPDSDRSLPVLLEREFAYRIADDTTRWMRLHIEDAGVLILEFDQYITAGTKLVVAPPDNQPLVTYPWRHLNDYDIASMTVTAGDWHIALDGTGDRRTYSCTARFADEAEWERNETIADAHPITLDTSIPFRFERYGDVDSFRIDTEQAGILTVHFDQWPAAEAGSDRPGFQWVNDADRVYPTSSASIRLDPGPVFLQLWSLAQRRPVHQPANFRCTLTPDTDPHEPNDRRDHATPIELNTTVPVILFPYHELDHFRIDINLPGELSITIDDWHAAFPGSTRPPSVLFAKADADSGWINPQALPVDAGTYVLQVRAPEDMPDTLNLVPHPCHMRVQFTDRRTLERQRADDFVVVDEITDDQPGLRWRFRIQWED